MNGPRVRWDLLVPSGLALLALLLASPGFGSGRTLFGVDVENVFHHQNALVGRFFREGALPTWDPHVMCGFPLLAAAQAAVFYPFTWLLALVDPGPYWTLTVLVHLALCGLFAFAWLRRGFDLEPWAAGLGAAVYMLAAPQVLRVEAGHANYLMAAPWLPALFWRLEAYLREPGPVRGAVLGGVAALLLLTGVPQLAFAAALVASARLLREGLAARRWKDVGRAAAWGALGPLLAAPQLLPALELVAQSQRASLGSSYAFAASFSLPLENLLTFVAPAFFGDHASVPYWGKEALWELGGYVGLGTLLLAALGLGGPHPLRRFWAGVALAALLVGLGRHAPLFRLFHAVVPGADFFRGPARYLAFFALAAAPLAALGLQRLLAEPAAARRAAARAGAAGLALALALQLGWAWLSTSSAWPSIVRAVDDGSPLNMVPTASRTDAALLSTTRAGARSALIWACAAAAASGGLLFAFGRGKLAPPACAAGLTLVLAAELLGFGARYFRGRETASREWPAEMVRHLRGRPEAPSRIASAGMDGLREPGLCRAAGLDHAGGYEPLLLRRYCELINAAAGRPADEPVVVALPWRPVPAIALLNVGHLLFPARTKPPDGLRVLGGLGDRVILELPGGRPRAWMASETRIVPDGGERLRVLADAGFDFRKVVVLEEPVDVPAGPPGSVRLLARGPGEYLFETDGGGGVLVLSECWYPGWSAELDGAPVPLRRAQHALQAVVVPPGARRVRFVYRARALPWGFALFALGAALPAALILRARWSGRP